MYAIVEIAGQQFKVEKDQEIFVHRLSEDSGASVEFDQVLLLDNEGKVTVGTPTVDGALIKAKILEHMKGDKVLVFHKKRRKGYQKENGHRQYLSKLLIEDILTGVKKKEKKEAPAKEEPKAKKDEPVKETKSKAEETTAKAKSTPEKEEKKEKPAAKATPEKEVVKEKEETKKPAAEAKKERAKEEKPAKAEAEKKEDSPKAAKEAEPKKAESKKEDKGDEKKDDKGAKEDK